MLKSSDRSNEFQILRHGRGAFIAVLAAALGLSIGPASPVAAAAQAPAANGFAVPMASTTTADWSATYSAPGVPVTWSNAQTRSFAVTVTNNGTQAWPSSGSYRVALGIHFANQGGGHGHNTFYTDQWIALGADVAPGHAVTLRPNVTAPKSQVGPMTLEFEMVKQGQFWFAAVKDVAVGTGLSARYGVSATPTSWALNGTARSYKVTVTNDGGEPWSAAGQHPVHLGVHFAHAPKGASSGWYTDQRFGLASDIGPGGTATLTLTVRPPTAQSGPMTLEYQMVDEGLQWFSMVADVGVSVGRQFKGTDGVYGTITFAFDGRQVSGFSDVKNFWICSDSSSQDIDISVPGNLAVDASGKFSSHLVTSTMIIDLAGTISGGSATGTISAQSNDSRGCYTQNPDWSATG